MQPPQTARSTAESRLVISQSKMRGRPVSHASRRQAEGLGLDHAAANRAPKPARGVDNRSCAGTLRSRALRRTTSATAIGSPRSINSTIFS